jgi:murein L,D-transpeptidase YcbB/YkuD
LAVVSTGPFYRRWIAANSAAEPVGLAWTTINPSALVPYALAAGLGRITGPILGSAQWLVQRLLLVAVGLALIGCSAAPSSTARDAAASPQSTRPVQIPSAQVSAEITKRVSSSFVPELGPLSAAERQSLESFYAPHASAVWTEATGKVTKNAHDALTLIEGAAAEGLDPGEYGAPQLGHLARTLDAADARPSPDQIAQFDVAMSAAALRYFTHLHFGRVDPRTIGLRLHIPADRHDVAVVLRSAIAAHHMSATAVELVPPLVQYRQLRDILSRYRSLAADTNVPPAPTFAATLHPGDSVAGSGLRDLARRLVAFGDLAADTNTSEGIYEGPLVEGVKRFQVRHGLEPDGVLGRSTQTALAIPLSWRVRQIELALERLRWLPDLTNDRVIALNIPMFHLWAFDTDRPGGLPAFTSRAIVGRALRTQTPVFVEELREVIFRPYWNVPRSILLGEILPLVVKDPAYLQRQAMEIVQGQGDDARPVPVTDENLTLLRQDALRLRQRPGPRNALGLTKFVFPNDANVYLHGTPAQELFSKARRDFSHGCVRVEDPVSLAEWVLKDQRDWTRNRIIAAMSGTVSQRVIVERPIQVVLFYVTAAVVPDDGTIHFAEDIYRHDATLDRALARR